MTQIPIELVGGPKDGTVLTVRLSCRVLAIPVIDACVKYADDDPRSLDKNYKTIHYERRMEDGQPVTNRAGNTLYDLVADC
jgi:hypothetical protein